MRLLDSASDCSVDVYNGLMAVEKADKVARIGNRLTQFLSRSEVLFLSHNAESRFGVALLHNHFSCKPGELVIQDEHTLEGEKVLVAQPEKIKEKAVPWLWISSENDFRPLEFTTDELAGELYQPEPVPEAFLAAFSELLQEFSAEHFFGLAIVERAFYKLAKPGERAFEYSDSENRKNIIYLTDKQNINSIETAWGFRKDMSPAQPPWCKAKCEITSKTICYTVCPIDASDPNHVKHRGPVHAEKQEKQHDQVHKSTVGRLE